MDKAIIKKIISGIPCLKEIRLTKCGLDRRRRSSASFAKYLLSQLLRTESDETIIVYVAELRLGRAEYLWIKIFCHAGFIYVKGDETDGSPWQGDGSISKVNLSNPECFEIAKKSINRLIKKFIDEHNRPSKWYKTFMGGLPQLEDQL